MNEKLLGWGNIPRSKPLESGEVALRLAQVTNGFHSLCCSSNPLPSAVWATTALLRSLLESPELVTPEKIERQWKSVSHRVANGKLPASALQNLFANFRRLTEKQVLHPLVAIGLSLAAFEEEYQTATSKVAKSPEENARLVSIRAVNCNRSARVACNIVDALEGGELFMALKQLLVFASPGGVLTDFPFPATEHRIGFPQSIVQTIGEIYARLPVADRHPSQGLELLQLVLNTANPEALRPESWNHRTAIAISVALAETERGLELLFEELADEVPSIPNMNRKNFAEVFGNLACEGKLAGMNILAEGLVQLTRRYDSLAPDAKSRTQRLEEVCDLVRQCIIHPDLANEEATTQAIAALLNAYAKLKIEWSMRGIGPFIESASHGPAAGILFDYLRRQIPSCESDANFSDDNEAFERPCALLKVILRVAPCGALAETSLEHLAETLLQVNDCLSAKAKPRPEALVTCMATLLSRYAEQLPRALQVRIEHLLFCQMVLEPSNRAINIARILNGNFSSPFFAWLKERESLDSEDFAFNSEQLSQMLDVLATMGLTSAEIAEVCFGSSAD